MKIKPTPNEAFHSSGGPRAFSIPRANAQPWAYTKLHEDLGLNINGRSHPVKFPALLIQQLCELKAAGTAETCSARSTQENCMQIRQKELLQWGDDPQEVIITIRPCDSSSLQPLTSALEQCWDLCTGSEEGGMHIAEVSQRMQPGFSESCCRCSETKGKETDHALDLTFLFNLFLLRSPPSNFQRENTKQETDLVSIHKQCAGV
jgi:hypothetical protein